MKNNVIYLCSLLLIITIASGCLKNSAGNSSILVPTGNFQGPFTLIHKNTAGKLDTATANIVLALSASAATYSVSGDTTTIQAPSHGTYNVDGTNILFTDATVSKTTNLNLPKKHLYGSFLYTFDGTNLHIYGSSDTLSYNYVLTSF